MKSGQLISFAHDSGNCWIILEVTLEMYRRSRYFRWNGYTPGFYAFRGFWYGRNPLSHKSFGKRCDMIHFSEQDYTVIQENTFCLKNEYLRSIL